jgi:hypothetical protein
MSTRIAAPTMAAAGNPEIGSIALAGYIATLDAARRMPS